MKNIEINKIAVSNNISFGNNDFFIYFTGHKDTKKIRPLCIFLPNMSACRKDLHETKFMSSLIKYDDLLEKYNEIWEKVKNSIEKKLIMNLCVMKNI